MLKPSYTFEALGTYWEVVTEHELSDVLKRTIRTLVDEFDHVYSRFRSDSLISKMAQEAGEYTFPEADKKLFRFYEQLYELTKGKVTPLVGASLEDLGYDAQYRFKPNEIIRTTPEYIDVVKRHGNIITISDPVVFDVGAAGKGYLVDLIAKRLDSHDYSNYVIDASGDIFHKGTEAEIVGLENPLQSGSVIGEVQLNNRALCASSTTRRSWGEGLHHIIDPSTNLPTKNYIATWVIADTAIEADGLATALFFSDPNILAKRYTYEYMRMKADGTVEHSQYFSDALYK